MAAPNKRDMNALIETALSEEKMRLAPITLHRRVEERLRIAALREKEELRFRYSMAAFAAVLCSVLTAAAFLLAFTPLGGLLIPGASGAKGQYDYYATSMALSVAGYRSLYALALSLLMAGGALFLGLFPSRKHTWTH